MPSYFYHISLEFLAGTPNPDKQLNRPSNSPAEISLFVEAAREALQPFQKKRTKAGKGPDTARKKAGRSTATAGENLQRQCRAPESGTTSQVNTSTTATYASSNIQNLTLPCPATPRSQLADDQRLDQISIQSIDMVPTESNDQQSRQQQPSGKVNNNNNTTQNQIAKGIGTNVIGGLATKGRYVPLDQRVSDSVWGIVHLYRDAEEAVSLYNDDEDPYYLKGSALARNTKTESASGKRYGSADVLAQESASSSSSAGAAGGSVAASAAAAAEDCTTLCILAVPSYLSPSDFLGFVGEETRDEVSHFRMIRTARANRYMVLMKFRSGKRAREWQRDWNGKVFNSMEPETCHVVFVKTVEVQVDAPGTESRFPDTNHDPFTPSVVATTNPSRLPATSQSQSGALTSSSLSAKPLAPPTPSLIELPTCPVCLERMDETTGLLTIICQHVFHCTCLQKWKGSGCPVCRYTQEDFGKRGHSFGFQEGPTECNVCHSEVNLWLCLVCGNVGCGRYDEAHAFAHFKQTSHSFAMDLATQRVWDYVGDGYVHRIIQNKSDGKLVELPAADNSALDPPDWADAVPREKLENMSVEYTHLLTSQLESQRTYFEEIVERAVDKASQASAAATKAQEAVQTTTDRLTSLQSQYNSLINETIPTLERDKDRATRRAEKFETMARKMEKEWREEKTMNTSLMEKVEFLDAEMAKLKVSNADLAEQNRDLSFFISGAEKLKELEKEQGQEGDVVEGTVSVPEPESGSGKKRKGKARAKR